MIDHLTVHPAFSLFGRVGIHDFTFEARSVTNGVTARRNAHPPDAAFVTRLDPTGCPAKPLASYEIIDNSPGRTLFHG